MPLAEIFVGFVNLWKEGEPVKARYHLFIRLEDRVHSFYSLEFSEILDQANKYSPVLQRKGIRDYIITHGWVLVNTPSEENVPCPSDYLTLEQRAQVEEVIGRYLKKIDK